MEGKVQKISETKMVELKENRARQTENGQVIRTPLAWETYVEDSSDTTWSDCTKCEWVKLVQINQHKNISTYGSTQR